MKSLFNTANVESTNTAYTKKIGIPQYLPSSIKPNIIELYNSSVYGKLMASINKSSVSEEEKQFLKLAASRHIVFNYSKIADYYANASAEMQNLMEESALVILDVDDAIANGYVKLSTRMQELVSESKNRRMSND